MIKHLTSRREFCFATLFLGATPALWAAPLPQQRRSPAPRVGKLTSWRALPGLEKLERAFAFLESASVDSKAPGRYDLDAERMYATITQNKTRAIEAAQFESHRKYIDLHYLIRGRELIGAADPANLREAIAYSAEKEIAMYERPEKYRKLILNPGEFVVFFPGQAHMPGCHAGKDAEIKKVVVKILAEAI